MRTLSLLLLGLAACSGGKNAEADVKEPSGAGGKPAASIKLVSPAFGAGEEIPSEYTCEGGNKSPPLAWEGTPKDAKGLAIIVDDPDAPDPSAPKRTFVHWVASLPAATTTLPAGAASNLPAGATVGRNDFGNVAWGGPCPPIGRHRYYFKLYALDKPVDASNLDKAALVKAMDGHVIGRGELIGTYQKR
jgi:Raf kinase inhibitor-like YbhB/YbcL family protein